MLSNVLQLTDEHDAIHAALRDEPVFNPPAPGVEAEAAEAAQAAAATRIAQAARRKRRRSKGRASSHHAHATAPAKSPPRLEANGAPAEDAAASARSVASARSAGSATNAGSLKGSVGSARRAGSGADQKHGVSPLLVRPSVEEFRRLEQMAASMTAPQILAEIKRMTADASPAAHGPHEPPLDRDEQDSHRSRDGGSGQRWEARRPVAVAAAWAPQPAPPSHPPLERRVSTVHPERSPAMRRGHGKGVRGGGSKRVLAPTLRATPTHGRGHASPPLLRRTAADEDEVALAHGEAVGDAGAAAGARARAAPAPEPAARALTPSSAAWSAARAAPGARGVAGARMAATPSQAPPAVRRGPASAGRPSPAGMMRLLPTAPDLSERTPTARHHRQDGGVPSSARKLPSGGPRSGGSSGGGGASGRRSGSPVSWRAPVADSPAEESPRTAAVKRAKAAAQAKKPTRPTEDALDPWSRH